MRATTLGVLFALTGGVPHAAPPATDGHMSRHIRPISRVLSANERVILEGNLHDDLETGRIRLGGRLMDVVAKYDPDLLFDHDGHTVAVYAYGTPSESLTHTYLVAKDGRLVRAWVTSCLPRDPYFDGMGEEEWQRWWKGYLAAEDARLLVKWAWWAKP